MHLYQITLDENRRELTTRGTPQFPLDMYCNELDKYPSKDVPWHWHGEMEFSYPLEGCLEIGCNNESVTLSAGEGAFINCNQLHRLRPVGDTPCTMSNIIFDPKILYGDESNVFAQKYVLPFTNCSEIGIIPFHKDVPWHREIMRHLEQAFMAYTDEKFGHEMAVHSHLTDIFVQLVRLCQSKMGQTHKKPDDTRIKHLLTYIHQHYMDDITLEEIAGSASNSPRECSRCFQEHLGMSAFTYLTNYRIRVAAAYLAQTDMPVTEICFSVGYNGTSYFGKQFRKVTGLTPREYRKNAILGG